MGNKITESEIEKFTIELLEKQGYEYVYAPDIAPDSKTPERESFEDVVLIDRLRSAIGRINPDIPANVFLGMENGKKRYVDKVIVKRTLRQYGYPPDMQKLATETVLKQAELIADELTKAI